MKQIITQQTPHVPEYKLGTRSTKASAETFLSEMLLEILLVLPLYVMIAAAVWRFRHVIKIMTDFEAIFADEVDTPEKGVEKREFLKDLISQGKKLPGNPSAEHIDKASDEEVEQLHRKYTQQELHRKGVKTGKAMGKHLIKLYSNGVCKVLKIDDLEQLRQDIDEDPIIKDSMADIGALMVSTFGKWLSPILIACHTANHTQGLMRSEEKGSEEAS